jgi:hypothetical protein
LPSSHDAAANRSRGTNRSPVTIVGAVASAEDLEVVHVLEHRHRCAVAIGELDGELDVGHGIHASRHATSRSVLPSAPGPASVNELVPGGIVRNGSVAGFEPYLLEAIVSVGAM